MLEAQSKTLAENCTKLETEKLALEKRDGDYWNEHTIINKLLLEEKERKVRNYIFMQISCICCDKTSVRILDYIIYLCNL